MTHPFPGNVRELENAIQATIALASGEEIGEQDLQLHDSGREALPDPGRLSLSEIEQRHIDWVLRSVGGNRREAARILGIDRSTLYRKMKRFASNDAEGDIDD